MSVMKALAIAFALFAALLAAQIALAAGAAFGAPLWSVHVMLGMGLVLLSIVILAIAVIGKAGRAAMVAAGVLLALTILQPIAAVLAERVHPAFGLIHGLVAALLIAFAIVATGRSHRHAAAA